ncbi:MAG: DUF1549 and DUF1553 domain-containing protein [Gemmatales bacterium]|nr:DUF1549 and DUF1553 domain-containing protein [Gemmatales bacterium]MDW7994717.1 DUF1549 and DUF1553 domain-containing protein [Gemmatales bacterium]
MRIVYRFVMMLAAITMFSEANGARAAELSAGPALASYRPKPEQVAKLEIYPSQVRLRGWHDAAQLIVTATLTDGRLQDLTGDVTYTVSQANVVRVSPSGMVTPLNDGAVEITASFGPHQARVQVLAEKVHENLPINFGNQIVPIFTKYGCNSGGCHGKISGQNGFRLSLLGSDPELDYMTLVKESRGRRLFLAAPEKSLLLLKGTGQLPHGGGKRLEVGSDEYNMILRWIVAGTPYGDPKDPVVVRISVYPERRVTTRYNRQQLAVYAHYSDGTVEDVTRRAQYETNDVEMASVDFTGLVTTMGQAGEAAIMIRYQGHVTVFRATVPLGLPVPNYTFEPKTIVDHYTLAKWRQLGLMPSEPASDEVFIRRAYLDITGTLPSVEAVRAFLADKDPKKRDKLIDRLVDSEEYAYYFALKWADILKVKRRNIPQRAQGTFAFHSWIKDSLAQDKPYSQFVREILCAVGDDRQSPPVFWYTEIQTPEQFVDDVAQVFLGTRINCAQCHHHPYEKYSQDDYWGMAAFYARVGRKNVVSLGTPVQNQNQARLAIFNRPTGTVTNKRTNQPAVMKPLDGNPVICGPSEDPRAKLVDWMTDPKNPFFARAVVNRYWAHFFGRGIVDPLDDMRETNPPTNPELLDALARDFIEHGFSLKHLVRTICKSRTYQLSAVPNDFNKHDKQSYARYYPKRMSAEVLFDAVSVVTGSPSTFPGMPSDRHGASRAIMLPDEAFQSYFLDVFGRPQRLSACECERVNEANLAQVLHLLNSQEIHDKLSRPGGRADRLANDPRPDAEKIEELFLLALGRRPTPEQLQLALQTIERRGPQNKKQAYEDIIWAIINTKEFLFIQ